jgi:hypothetical protein
VSVPPQPLATVVPQVLPRLAQVPGTQAVLQTLAMQVPTLQPPQLRVLPQPSLMLPHLPVQVSGVQQVLVALLQTWPEPQQAVPQMLVAAQQPLLPPLRQT